MLKLLKFVCSFGRFLAITPWIQNKDFQIRRTKIYTFLVITSLTVAVPVSLYHKRTEYAAMVHVRLALAVLTDVTLYSFNFFTIMSVPFWKRHKWEKILKKLRKLNHMVQRRRNGTIFHYVAFFLFNTIFWVLTISDLIIWYEIVGFEYIQQYLVDGIQTYFLCFYYTVLYTIIKTFIEHYKKVRFLLEKFQPKQTIMQGDFKLLVKIEDVLCLLKETVDIFNDIFGWPILLMVLYTGLMVIEYLDYTLKNYDHLEDDDLYKVATSNVCLVFLFFTNTLLLIWMCDLVLQESEKIFKLATKLRDIATIENKEVEDFIYVVCNHLPRFSVARFFLVDRTTICSVLSTITTFLIVMFQFKVG